MDFKAQILKDLKVFHNPGEFAEMMNIWYAGSQYEVPAVLDHLTEADRKQPGGDNSEGIYRVKQYCIYPMTIWGLCRKRGGKSR